MNKSENQIKKNPIVVDKDEVIQIKQITYLLHESDYLRLTKIQSFLPIWAHSLFAGMSIYLISIIAKLIAHGYFGSPDKVSQIEWITLAIIIFLVILFEGLYLFLPSERKKTIKKIEQHFKNYN